MVPGQVAQWLIWKNMCRRKKSTSRGSRKAWFNNIEQAGPRSVCLCVLICMCEWERERGTDGQTDRERQSNIMSCIELCIVYCVLNYVWHITKGNLMICNVIWYFIQAQSYIHRRFPHHLDWVWEKYNDEICNYDSRPQGYSWTLLSIGILPIKDGSYTVDMGSKKSSALDILK